MTVSALYQPHTTLIKLYQLEVHISVIYEADMPPVLVLIFRDVSTHAHSHLTGPRARSQRSGRGPAGGSSSSTARQSLCRWAQPAAVSSRRVGRSNRRLDSTSARGVPAATVSRYLHAHGCDSYPACAETGVQCGEMRLPVCDLSCETACDAACMCICVRSCPSDGVRERASVDA